MKWKDKIEALKRSDKYRKDYEEYERWRIEQGFNEGIVLDAFESNMSEKAKALCTKYHIPHPIDPDRTTITIYGADGETEGSMENDLKTPAIRIDLARLGNNENYGHVLWDSQFLTVQLTIDTSKTQRQVEDEFKKLYQHLLTQGPLRQRVPRTTLTYQGKKIDHWLVFDMMKQKKNRSKVMKELFGIRKNPSYSKKAMSRYKQVERYYKKALSLINMFEGKHLPTKTRNHHHSKN